MAILRHGGGGRKPCAPSQHCRSG